MKKLIVIFILVLTVPFVFADPTNSHVYLPAVESRFLHNAPGSRLNADDFNKPLYQRQLHHDPNSRQTGQEKTFRQRLEEAEKRLSKAEQRIDSLTQRLDKIENINEK